MQCGCQDRNIFSIIQHKIYFSMCGLSCWNTSGVHDYHVLMTPCSSVVSAFRTCSFRLQVRTFLLRKWRQQVPPKHRRPYAKEHGGILQKTEIFIVVTVGTTDPLSENKFSAKGKVQKIWLAMFLGLYSGKLGVKRIQFDVSHSIFGGRRKWPRKGGQHDGKDVISEVHHYSSIETVIT